MGEDGVEVEGLAEADLGAGLFGGGAVGGGGGHEQDAWWVGKGAAGTGDVPAVQAGEDEIEEDDVGMPGAHVVQGSKAVGGGADVKASVGEGGGEEVADAVLVVDDEDTRAVVAGVAVGWENHGSLSSRAGAAVNAG